MSRPVAASRGLHNYQAVNEPIYGYEPGSTERNELEAKLKEYNSKVHEVPIIIGDEEIRTDEVRMQVRVSSNSIHPLLVLIISFHTCSQFIGLLQIVYNLE